MKLLEIGKDMKIKQSVSYPSPVYPKVWGGDFFLEKALHEGTNDFGQFIWALFYMGSNDQIIQGEETFQKYFFQ